MNQPIPIQEKHLRFSLAQLPMDKALGYLFCLVQINRKLTILAGIILIIGAVSIVYVLCGENSEWIELRNLNRQASQSIYKNQPEEAIVIYDRIQEHLSHLKSNKTTRQWTRRIQDSKTMAATACERKLIRACQSRILEAQTLMKNGKEKDADKILKQVLADLKTSPWKGKPTQTMIAQIQAIKDGR
jgi:hypothetical protein